MSPMFYKNIINMYSIEFVYLSDNVN